MAVTKVAIISRAISILGHKPIITLDTDDADDLVIAAEQAFDQLLPASIAENSWRFATQISELSEIVGEIPPTKSPWTKVYQLPAGYLGNLRVYPQNYQYEIYADLKLYTTWTGATFMEHLFLPEISRLPPWFVKTFVYELAAELALTNAQKTEYYTALEAKRVTQMAIAMGLDAKSRPNNIMQNFPMLNISSGDTYTAIGE